MAIAYGELIYAALSTLTREQLRPVLVAMEGQQITQC